MLFTTKLIQFSYNLTSAESISIAYFHTDGIMAIVSWPHENSNIISTGKSLATTAVGNVPRGGKLMHKLVRHHIKLARVRERGRKKASSCALSIPLCFPLLLLA